MDLFLIFIEFAIKLIFKICKIQIYAEFVPLYTKVVTPARKRVDCTDAGGKVTHGAVSESMTRMANSKHPCNLDSGNPCRNDGLMNNEMI